MNLTIKEIRDLAEFAGLYIDTDRSMSDDDMDSEITIEDHEAGFVLSEEDGSERQRFRRIAYFAEYPEEGSIGLGDCLPGEEG